MDARLIIGLLGSAVLIAGVVARSPRRKDGLFAVGNACMFAYALLGYIDGGPIFFLILQIFIAVSTISMLLRIRDALDTPILAISGMALVAWSLSLFEGYATAIFVVGLAVLGIGFAMDDNTTRREVALMIGSAIVAVFSFLMRDWVFVGLNTLFALLSAVNMWRITRVASVSASARSGV